MNNREIKTLEFIDTAKHCTRRQIQELFYSDTSESYCCRSLNSLVENKYIKRRFYNIENNINSYVYYKGKAINKRLIRHDLMISETIVQFMKNYSIKEVLKIPKIDDVIPDALVVIRTGYSLQPILIEVQLSPNDCFTKYYNFAQKFRKYSGLDEKPILYIVTDIELNVKKLRDLHVVVDDLSLIKVRGILRCCKD